jgi:hypothetical protein
MLKTVWKACEEELRRLAEGWKEAIETCYPVRFISRYYKMLGVDH